jgi:hypothetical protein
VIPSPRPFPSHPGTHSERIQYGKEEWRRLFGVYWAPSDYQIIQDLGLTELNLQSWQAQEIVYRFRKRKEDIFFRSFALGWVIAVLMCIGGVYW